MTKIVDHHVGSALGGEIAPELSLMSALISKDGLNLRLGGIPNIDDIIRVIAQQLRLRIC